jgi:CheY-like chemotaxis protein
MQSPYKILVVEDEPVLNELLCELLHEAGYETRHAYNGVEASELLQKEEFDLLMSDFQMPKMNGVELLRWCRERDIHFPVIFITANVELLPEEDLALNDCCAAVIHKPFCYEEVVQAVIDAKQRNHNRDCHISSGPGNHHRSGDLRTSPASNL